MLYPLKMKPFFRHGEQTPWGGHALKDMFGKDIPDDRTGESLEISALKDHESVVLNGELAGRTLTECIELWGDELTGCGKDFPLLLKLLDAKEMLSVQVHPDDSYASANEGGKLGKTEAWLIISAEPGAKLVYGVSCDTSDQLRQLVNSGELESALRWVTVKPGDVLYIPHGCVHALGGGIVVYEIQQSSDVTYRFWDWGRVGKDGKPRALHIDKSLDVSRPQLKLSRIDGATIIVEGGSRTYYIADRNFELSRLNLSGDMPLPSGRMLLLTAMCECTLSWDGGSFDLIPGESCLVPAAMTGVRLKGLGKVMCSTTPDQAALSEALGYRAELVSGLTEDI